MGTVESAVQINLIGSTSCVMKMSLGPFKNAPRCVYKLVKSEIYTNRGFKLVLCGFKIFICGNSKSFMVTDLVCGSITDKFKIFNSYASFRKIESFKNER